MHSDQSVSVLAEAPASRLPEALSTRSRRGLDRLTLAAAAVMVIAYVIYFATLTPPPLQDFPNHLARAAIIADALFDGGARFGGAFSVHLMPIPYVLHDVVFASLIQAFGATAGAAVFLTLVLLSLPAALWLYMHVMKVELRTRVVVLLLSLMLATDWFFLMAFMAFRLAVALVIVGLAAAELLRREWSGARYAAYIGVLVAGYLTHLSAPVFLLPVMTVVAGVRLVMKRSTFAREAQLVLPVCLLLAMHVGLSRYMGEVGSPAAYLYEWGSLPGKLQNWWYEFGRFGGRSSQLLTGLLAISVLLAIRHSIRRSTVTAPLVVEHFLVALVFLGVYILLPQTYSDSAYVDVRALVMITLFLLLTALSLVEAAHSRGFESLPVRVLALTVSALNLGVIAWKMAPVDAWLGHYRQIVAAVPEGARVLPIYTGLKVGAFSPFLHAGSFAVLDRAATIPYLFAGDKGDPMKYFTYRASRYQPPENWYVQQLKWRDAVPATYTVLGRDYTWRFQYSEVDRVWEPLKLVPIEWGPVACDYEWLLVARPYQGELIGVPATLVKQNDAAALLRVDKSACRPAPARRVRLSTEH
jgi:hypothetical protein